MKYRRASTDVMKTLKEQKCQRRGLYPAILSITIDGESKLVLEKNNFSTKPALQRIVNGKQQQKY